MEKTIFEQLKKEHTELKALLSKAEESSVTQRRPLLDAITDSFIPHSRGEEKTLYADLHKHAIEEADEAYQEHRMAERILNDLKKMDVGSEQWLPKLQDLRKSLEHHIQEEETALFDQAKRTFSEHELHDLLEEYVSAKSFYEDSLPAQAPAAHAEKRNLT